MTGLPQRVDLQALPASVQVGEGVRVFASSCVIEPGVVLHDNTTLVADDLHIGSRTVIGNGCDLRAADLRIGPSSEIAPRTRALVATRMALGAAARIARDVNITCRSFETGNLLYLGDELTVGYGGTTASTATVRIGNRVTIGQHTILNANLPITIGDDVGTGSYLAIWTHGYHFGHGPMIGFEATYAPVTIERNVWLGYHVTILPGVTIGADSIVAAGSLVTRGAPPGVLLAGTPATVRKHLHIATAPIRKVEEATARVLDHWRRELTWKGCDFETDNDVTRVSPPGVAQQTAVVLLRSDREVPEIPEGERWVLITIARRRDIESVVSDHVAVLCIADKQVRGRLCSIGEDVRDHLRRHAMPCGETNCFNSIEPTGFERLKRTTER